MPNQQDLNIPIVYSCSGCSSAAQMANYIAIKLDREKIAEMSCIAGVGGDVKPLVAMAKSGRKIITVDGCPLVCSQKCLSRHQLTADKHFTLSDFDVCKKKHVDFDKYEAEQVYENIKLSIKLFNKTAR